MGKNPRGVGRGRVMSGELQTDMRYFIPLRFAHYVFEDDPGSGEEACQVHCSLCGGKDVINPAGANRIKFCYNCGACFLDEIPEEALNEREVFRKIAGDTIDRDEEESE